MCLVDESPELLMNSFNVDNLILAGTSCGSNKPIMDLFAKSFLNEMQKLSTERITVMVGDGEVTWKVVVLQLVC